MSTRKFHSLTLAALIVLLGLITGGFLGWVLGSYQVQLFAEEAARQQPNYPREMLPIMRYAFAFMGAALGAVVGAITAVTLHFMNKRRQRLL